MKLKNVVEKLIGFGRAVCPQTAARRVGDNAPYQMLKIMAAGAAIFIGGNVFSAPYVTNVVAKQRYPWNGLVDVKYEIVGSTNEISGYIYGSLKAMDRDTGKVYPASTFVKPLDLSEGVHHAIWNMSADVEIVSSNVVFTVSIEKPSLYLVVDLSAGPDATVYPVSEISAEPEGGWTEEYKTEKLVLRLIAPGSFKMNGSYDVTLTKPYYMGVFEITEKQFNLVTAYYDRFSIGDKFPQIMSWDGIRGDSAMYNWPLVKTVDLNSFIGRLRARTGLIFDLPTEAQWEYACRAGTTTAYSYGDVVNGEYMWYSGNSGGIREVGIKLPNQWGLYDMHGNAWEWCLDWCSELTSGFDPEGSSLGSKRVLRGGCSKNASCTSSSRHSYEPRISYSTAADLGFRIVRNLSK